MPINLSNRLDIPKTLRHSGIVYRHRMGLRVYYIFVQINQFRVVAKKQIKVFQRFTQKERLHHVLWPDIPGVPDIPNRRVTVRYLRVLLKSLNKNVNFLWLLFVSESYLEYLPAPILVSNVAGKLVHVPKAFYELGTE